MGGSQSTEIPGGGSDGYHVLKVIENSPGYFAGLEPYFDYIVSINEIRMDQDNDMLKNVLQKNIDQPVKMIVYNSKSRTTREVMLTPTNTWGGQGLLGVSIRFCSFDGACESVWHILDVHPNSPAALAGLIPHTDYILGSDLMGPDDDIYSVIEANNLATINLNVYNSETDKCREVSLVPNLEWGGEGSIGCDIGYGYLHRIPVRQPNTVPSVNRTEPGVITSVPQSTPHTTSVPLEPVVSTNDGLAEVPLLVPSLPTTPVSSTSDVISSLEDLSLQTSITSTSTSQITGVTSTIINIPSQPLMSTGGVTPIKLTTSLPQSFTPPKVPDVTPISQSSYTMNGPSPGYVLPPVVTTSPSAFGTTGLSIPSYPLNDSLLGDPPSVNLPSSPPMINLGPSPQLTQTTQ